MANEGQLVNCNVQKLSTIGIAIVLIKAIFGAKTGVSDEMAAEASPPLNRRRGLDAP
jgi:hypothetical protein